VFAATVLALTSAVLHVSWNLLVKTSGERFLTAWGQFAIGSLLTSPVLLFTGLPGAGALPYLVTSAVVQVVYVGALVRAYHHGDLSVAYPVARGGGALLAAAGGALFLDDHLSGAAWLAIAVVVGALASLARPSPGRAALVFAGLTAATIGAYTTVDAAGARGATSGLAYGIASQAVAAAALTVAGVSMGRTRTFVAFVRTPVRGRLALGGVASVAAYTMVLVAARRAPVGYVAALRESSVVLAALAGWLLLDERFGRARLASATVAAMGLLLLVAVR
jgi:drug/metabolite transporter (DMT)-like permease